MITLIKNTKEPQQCGSCRIPVLPESVFLDFLDAEALYVRLTQTEEFDEVGAIHIAYKLSLDGMLPTHLLGDFAQLQRERITSSRG